MRIVRRRAVILGSLLVCLVSPCEANSRKTKCFKIDPQSVEAAQKSAHLLCMTSADLKRYPKSVVAFSLMRKDDKAPMRPEVPGLRAVLLARRHYISLGSEKFGLKSRPEEPMVSFDNDQNTVFIGFHGKQGTAFHFYRVDNPAREVAQSSEH